MTLKEKLEIAKKNNQIFILPKDCKIYVNNELIGKMTLEERTNNINAELKKIYNIFIEKLKIEKLLIFINNLLTKK